MTKADNTDDMAREIRSLIAEVIEEPEDVITDEASFIDDLGVDSLMAIQILVAIERKYRIHIAEEDMRGVIHFKSALAVARKYVVNAVP